MKFTHFLNKYSHALHMLLSCVIVFLVELISRRSILSTMEFIIDTPLTYLYNAFLVLASLSFVYLVRRRALMRLLISTFWIVLGIINGVILSNRVTPFNFCDLHCITDLLSMKKTGYLTPAMTVVAVICCVLYLIGCVIFYRKGPVYTGKIHRIGSPLLVVSMIFIAIPCITSLAQKENVIDTYFANIAEGYEEYGFVYAFSSGVLDRGMKEPADYSKENINAILDEIDGCLEPTSLDAEAAPNIICVLLESFIDPDEINFLSYSQDPVPFYHYLEENFTTGYLSVPVVGAGTANSEFEVLTGMKVSYFGTGEYPYKTILKQTDCRSVASALQSLGYVTHAVHNNGKNFYSRANAFSRMDFDTFTSEEQMHITEYTPNGGWAEDAVLVDETIETLLITPNQKDFTYTITVGTHGPYPTSEILEHPFCKVYGIDSTDKTNQWTYYLHQLHKTDMFMAKLIDKLNQLEEDTLVVFWGDHLPTMGLTNEDMASGDIYKTTYVTWNNFGLEKEDADLYAYQLMADILDTVGIHEGIMMTYHQTQAKCLDAEAYLNGIELLQYDILYGKRFSYEQTYLQN